MDSCGHVKYVIYPPITIVIFQIIGWSMKLSKDDNRFSYTYFKKYIFQPLFIRQQFHYLDIVTLFTLMK